MKKRRFYPGQVWRELSRIDDGSLSEGQVHAKRFFLRKSSNGKALAPHENASWHQAISKAYCEACSKN